MLTRCPTLKAMLHLALLGKQFLDQRHEYENKFIDILIEGVKQGEFKNLNPRISLFTILSSMRWMLHWYYANWEFEQSLERTRRLRPDLMEETD